MRRSRIILTSYICPIEKTPCFFDGLYFSNPKTEEEVDEIAAIIREANETDYNIIEEGSYENPGLREAFYNFCINNSNSPSIKKFYETNLDEQDVYKIIAKMWVVVYCDSVIDLEAEKKINWILSPDVKVEDIDFEKERQSYRYLNEANFEKIKSYMDFLRFFTFNEEELPNTILINNTTNIQIRKISMCLLEFYVGSFCKVQERQSTRSLPFYMVWEQYYDIIKKVGDKYKTEKFNYICSLMSNLSDVCVSSKKQALLILVGLIEMLLTHNPEQNRFNVENSITRQFTRKLTLLIYEEERTIDTERVKDVLKIIYDLRSVIAHGDFEKLEKIYMKICAIYDINIGETDISYVAPEDSLEYLFDDVYKFTKIVINNYLCDEKRLNLLKDI